MSLRDALTLQGVLTRKPDTPPTRWPRPGDTRHINGKDQTWLCSRWLDNEGLSPEQRLQVRRHLRNRQGRTSR